MITQDRSGVVGSYPSKRRRGVLLSASGRQRLHDANRIHQFDSRSGARRSLDQVSHDVGLSTKTISRVLHRDLPVDRRTLEMLFDSLGIDLRVDDYVCCERNETFDRERIVIPQRRSTFFGRQDELDRLRKLLVEKRAITLVGPGGIGKTRLALEATSRFGGRLFGRVAYCDLSVLRDASGVAATIARAVEVLAKKPPLAQVTCNRVLIIVDNCEHVLATVAAIVDDLLRTSSQIVILATSREPLGIEGEIVSKVRALEVPERRPMTAAEALAFPAVALFVDRACEADDGFAFDEMAVATAVEIVARVEAIPLAVELAASHVATLALSEIARGLRDQMTFLVSDSTRYDERHRSMRALVASSYDLLDDDERIVFRTASVFAGSFDIDAVERSFDGGRLNDVASVVARLARKSVLCVDLGATTHYRMFETMRQFAAQRLRDSGETPAARLRHAPYFNDLLARAEAASEHQAEWERKKAMRCADS